MIKVYINDTDITDNIEFGSVSRNNAIQQRSDSLSFSMFRGTKPSENQDIRFFICDEVDTIDGSVITLKGKFERKTNKFFQNQEVFLRISENNETKAIVNSFNETTLELELTETPSITINEGDLVGWLFFGGVVSRVADRNVTVLSNLEFDVECTDYTKIFDKKIISDTWEGVDGRYIINDFVNTTVNYNSTIDNLSYADNTAIQAEWIESGTANNPTIDTTDYIEGSASLKMTWTGAGDAVLEGTPPSIDLSALTGASSGSPLAGELMIWIKPVDYTKITSIKLRVGSDSSNYAELELDSPVNNDFNYLVKPFELASVTGTPDWTSIDYAAIIINGSASSTVYLNGFRLNNSKSFTLKNVSATIPLTQYRAPQIKPSSFLQTLSKNFQYIWWIDYERDIHFVASGDVGAVLEFTDSSDNFQGLNIEVDQSQLGNRVIIRGGEKTSIGTYTEIREGNNAQREWLMKSKFNNLVVTVDDGTSSHSAESGTTTTNIKLTAHGLSSGDYIVNRSRDNAVREVTIVDVDNFTVEAVPSQTSGDNITFFSISKDIGIEGLVDETSVNYLYNSNEKSIRSTSIENTLDFGVFIKFTYNERVNIQIQYLDPVSSNGLKALGLGDGIFDLDPITDRNIKDVTSAVALAQAKVNDYRNPIISGGAQTDRDGLQAGQTIHIQDSVRGIDSNFVIQTIRTKFKGGEYNDYMIHNVSFGTTLFGIIEFYQKLLSQKDSIEVGDSSEPVETYINGLEDVEFDSAGIVIKGGFKKSTQNEIVEMSEANQSISWGQPWRWEVSTGQPLKTRWNLFQWG